MPDFLEKTIVLVCETNSTLMTDLMKSDRNLETCLFTYFLCFNRQTNPVGLYNNNEL